MSKYVVTLKWGQRSLKVIESGILLVFFSNFVPKMHRFEIFDFKYAVTLKTELGITHI